MSVLKWLLKTAAVTALLFAAFVLPVLLWIYAPAYLALFFLFSACAAILFGAYIVSRAMPPEYKISWMFPALIAPFLGGALFLFFGNSRFGLKNDRSYTKKSLGLDAYLPAPAQGDGLFFEAAETIFCETGYPAARGDVSYYATGERFFDALLSAIEGAKHFVFLEFFIAKKGVLWDRLEGKGTDGDPPGAGRYGVSGRNPPAGLRSTGARGRQNPLLQSRFPAGRRQQPHAPEARRHRRAGGISLRRQHRGRIYQGVR